jgi:hypothetical protein
VPKAVGVEARSLGTDAVKGDHAVTADPGDEGGGGVNAEDPQSARHDCGVGAAGSREGTDKGAVDANVPASLHCSEAPSPLSASVSSADLRVASAGKGHQVDGRVRAPGCELQIAQSPVDRECVR